MDTLRDGDAVTEWIAGLKAGEAEAAERLWQYYFGCLVGLARQKLGHRPGRLGDEEDVALSAFKSFCVGAAAGRFPRLRDRDALWPLLVVLTVRKVLDFRKHEGRRKRGGGRQGDLDGGANIEALFSREPSPELAVMVAENCQRFLDQLEAAPRQIAELKLDGYTNIEIAERLGCGLRTVERRLELIRRTWDREP